MGVIDWRIKLAWEPDLCCVLPPAGRAKTVTGLTRPRRFRIRTEDAKC